MPGSPELLPIIEAESTGTATRLQLGPQCCCASTISCSGMTWPEFFGVEFHGTPSDPGGASFCDDYMQRFGNTPTDLLFGYGVDLTDFFGTPIEVQYFSDLAPCTWCPPITPEYTQETADTSFTVHSDCAYIYPTCKGLVEVGGNSYGFQSVVSSSAVVHSSCVVDCDNIYDVTYTFRLASYPLIMDLLQVSIAVSGGGTTVTVDFTTVLRQGFIETQTIHDCAGVTIKDVWNCDTSFLSISPISGTFSRTFPAGYGWNDIKDQQIPGTITGYNTSGASCAAMDGGGVITGETTCAPGLPSAAIYSCVGNFKLPRLSVADAYCILREL